MAKKKSWELSRRTFLRGAGATIALPTLNAMAPSIARAQGLADPVRAVVMVFPHGLPQNTSGGSGQGTTYTLPDNGTNMFGPLLAQQGDFLNLAGLDRETTIITEAGDHPIGFASILTHQHIESGTTPSMSTSFDQLIADHYQPATQHLPSLELTAEGYGHLGGAIDGIDTFYGSHMAWRGDVPKVALVDVGAAFDDVFPDGFDGNTNEAQRAEMRRQGKSVLDYVTSDIGRLNQRLGSEDKATVDAYLTAIHSLESRISAEVNFSCEKGTRPVSNFNGEDHTQGYPERVDQMLDLMALALQCDSTRVITFRFGDVYSALKMNTFLPGMPDKGFHKITHENHTEHAEAIRYFSTKYIEFLNKLKAIQETNSSLFDNSMVLLTSEQRSGQGHLADNLPVFLGGRGGGAINPGRRIDYGSAPIAKLYISMMQACGMSDTQFKGVTGGLAGLA